VSDDDVAREVEERCTSYEIALMAYDFPALADFFLPDAIRFGPHGNQHGRDTIDAARRSSTDGVQRDVTSTTIRVLGPDAAVTITEFVRSPSGRAGRQTQVWVRDGTTWRISHAHVSVLPG
jgi:uncharacterized protein (TIGR02246 family)